LPKEKVKSIMVSSKILCPALLGLEVKFVEIEVEISSGLRSFNIVGLPDKAIAEARERVDAALKNSKFSPPSKRPFRVVVNLAPADLKKEGSLYDLPIALAYLLKTKQTNFDPSSKIFLGELSLDGNLRRVKGVLPITLSAFKNNIKEIILPKENAIEAGLVKGIKVIGVSSLKEAIDYLEGKKEIKPLVTELQDLPSSFFDISWIKGQEYPKRALEISAAGGHHLFFFGPPGTGKSILAKSICSILPKLNEEEILELTQIYSVAGLLDEKMPIVNQRPFRSPHHSSSEPALIGGGNPLRPGEITLAHKGVLFLDEFPEFHRDVLESLRQPIEEGKITILRAKERVVFPASFTLIAASNPCPCGYFNHPEIPCKCSPSQIASYRRKLSGPLMDRIDLFVEVPQIKFEKLIQKDDDFEKETEKIKERVERAREIQMKRRGKTNSQLNIKEIEKDCQIDSKSENLLKKYVDSQKLSIRGYHKVLKVARTISDLKEKEKISFEDVAEALNFRVLFG
jgi:magnesium chelatase family protein